jgi:predicted SAM-dependent methyltransferase
MSVTAPSPRVWEAPSGVEVVVAAGRSARSSVLVASGKALTRALRRRGERRLRTAVDTATGPVKVSFGAGTVDLPGWIDTDLTWHAEFCLDATRPWPVDAGSLDFVYADQVIEHFPLEVGRAVLRHAFDALVPGGAIRLATPDVERTARMYLARGSECATHLERHRERGYSAEHPVDVLRVTFSENGHRFCYDFDSLRCELEWAGFVDVRRHEAGESDEPEFRDLESRVDPTEVATTLAVEARKPGARRAGP